MLRFLKRPPRRAPLLCQLLPQSTVNRGLMTTPNLKRHRQLLLTLMTAFTRCSATAATAMEVTAAVVSVVVTVVAEDIVVMAEAVAVVAGEAVSVAACLSARAGVAMSTSSCPRSSARCNRTGSIFLSRSRLASVVLVAQFAQLSWRLENAYGTHELGSSGPRSGKLLAGCIVN